MKNNEQARERFFETVRKAMKDFYAVDMSPEKIAYLSKFTEQMLEKAREGFVCSECKAKHKLVVLNNNDYENPRS